MHVHILVGDEWHLRKCNWAGESAETVDDEVKNSINNNSGFSPSHFSERPCTIVQGLWPDF